MSTWVLTNFTEHTVCSAKKAIGIVTAKSRSSGGSLLMFTFAFSRPCVKVYVVQVIVNSQ